MRSILTIFTLGLSLAIFPSILPAQEQKPKHLTITDNFRQFHAGETRI